MTFKEIQDYFRQMAIQNKLTAHNPPERNTFFRMDHEEDLAAVPSDAGSPYVKVLNFSGRFGGDVDMMTKDEVIKLRFAAKANPDKTLSEEIERAQNEAYQLMMQFIQKIVNDMETDPCGSLLSRKINESSWGPVGPVNQYEYGWEITIPIQNNMPAYNANNWNP